MRTTLYSQEELERYHLDESDLQYPWDFETGPSGSQIIEQNMLREDSSEMEIGNPRVLTL